MSVVVNLNEGAACPICDRGRLGTVGTNVWDCSRCNSQFYFADEGDGRCSLSVRDKPKLPFRFIPQVSKPWNPAYRPVWEAMTKREKQISFLIDIGSIVFVLLVADLFRWIIR